MKIRAFASALAVVLGMGTCAMAQVSDNVIKIGVLTDMSGPFSHQTGEGSVTGAKFAAEEFDGKINGVPIEVVFADHQNKPDVALSIARQWIDVDGVDVIADLASSAVALAIQDLVRDKNRVALFTGPGTDRLTNQNCSPNGIHWVYDTYAAGNAMAQSIIEDGGKKWFFIGLDSAFGRSMVETMSKAITASGGKIVGSVWHPTGTSDYSSFIVQARSSGADVLVLANSGTDFVAAVKQAREFGITGDRMRLVGPAITMRDILALGPEQAAGLHYVDAFYWNLNDATRALTNKFHDALGVVPGQAQAGTYSAVRSYLLAVQEAGTDSAPEVMKKLHSMEISDGFTPSGKVRPDGRMVHDMYLVRAKDPGAEKITDWDVVDLVKTIPGDQAFRPLSDSECPLLK